MLGRAYRFFPIIGIQRPDAAYFAGARDNFQCCLALGNLSREGRKMLFPDEVAESITQCSKREGHLYIDGVGIEKIRIAEVQSMAALDEAIQEAMSPLKRAERAAKQREEPPNPPAAASGLT